MGKIYSLPDILKEATPVNYITNRNFVIVIINASTSTVTFTFTLMLDWKDLNLKVNHQKQTRLHCL